jgi:hypothetical protein
MCTEYRLSVTPEKIVVQDRDNRGHFLQWWAAGAWICTASLQLCRIDTYSNKKLRERKGKKGIALRDIASKVHLIARLDIPWQVGYLN